MPRLCAAARPPYPCTILGVPSGPQENTRLAVCVCVCVWTGAVHSHHPSPREPHEHAKASTNKHDDVHKTNKQVCDNAMEGE